MRHQYHSCPSYRFASLAGFIDMALPRLPNVRSKCFLPVDRSCFDPFRRTLPQKERPLAKERLEPSRPECLMAIHGHPWPNWHSFLKKNKRTLSPTWTGPPPLPNRNEATKINEARALRCHAMTSHWASTTQCRAPTWRGPGGVAVSGREDPLPRFAWWRFAARTQQ